MKRYISLMALLTLFALCARSQDSEAKRKYDEFRKQAHAEYDSFRKEANSKYAAFKEEAWREYQSVAGIPKPQDEEIQPVTVPQEELQQPVENTPVTIGEVLTTPGEEPQPVPVAPIHEKSAADEVDVDFTYCGTQLKARFKKGANISLGDCSNQQLTAAWNELASDDYNNTIRDCLEIRIRLQLSDWAYLNMLNAFSESCFGKGSDANFLTAYLYCQSGYKMRIGRSGNTVCLLYATKHCIYNDDYFEIDGYKYYPYNCDLKNLQVYDMPFPQEQPMSLYIPKEQLFDYSSSEPRTLTSKKYPEVSVSMTVNTNMMDFYNSYPTSDTDGNFMTRWAMYANTPLDSKVKEELYPALQGVISGLSQEEAADRLLNWVQTAFVYEFDNKVWGYDRAFFAEETLFYPYCDCEDRSILFSRLVRDLLGLKVVLVYYPRHLATAVCFTDQVEGNFISVSGKRFVVCDPTYIGAPVGKAMTGFENVPATVVLLE